MDRLTPLAASFIEAEDVDTKTSLAIGSLAEFAGPPPDFDEFVSQTMSRRIDRNRPPRGHNVTTGGTL